MKIITAQFLNFSQKRDIFELWNKEYPANITFYTIDEFDNYLNDLEDQFHILLIDEENKVKGWYFDFIREKERWFAMILDATIQDKKFGTQLLGLAKQTRKELNGWVIISQKYLKANGELYLSPLAFYQKMAFQAFPEEKLETSKINAIKIKWQLREFPKDFYKYLRDHTLIEIKGGLRRLNFSPIWMVVVKGRIFARSWNKSEKSWFTEFQNTGVGQIKYEIR